jgi:hypothetical protein
VVARRPEAKDPALVRREPVPRLGQQAADRLPPDPARLDEAGQAQLAEMPRDERLAQADVVDELGNGRLALGEATDDPEPVDVGQGLVDEADRAEVFGLVDDRRDRGADAGAGRAQGSAPVAGSRSDDVGSIGVYINMR